MTVATHDPALAVPRPVVPAHSRGTSGTLGVQGAPAEADERTRDRVLAAVLEHGPVSAAELGESLGFTPAAMRRHLDALSHSGLIEVKQSRGSATGAGRPARRYVLSQRGQRRLGNDYLDIAKDALVQLQAVAGPDAIQDFARHRFADMEERYRPALDRAGSDLEDRAEALAAALSADGYVGSTKVVGSAAPTTAMLSVQLCQGHCPVQQLAEEFPAFCEQESQVFSRLLGVDVRRLSTLARGGHVCTTHIPVGRKSAPAASVPDEQDSIQSQIQSQLDTLSTHQQGRP